MLRYHKILGNKILTLNKRVLAAKGQAKRVIPINLITGCEIIEDKEVHDVAY